MLTTSQRRLLTIAVVIAMSAGLASTTAAQTAAPYVRVFVDGAPVAFDQPPVIVGGRVLVPLRGVFERLGATVTWDPISQTVLAQSGATSVSLRIGSPQAFVSGQPQTLDVPAMLVGGRTLVPLRFVSQALGAGVTWDAASSTVQIAGSGAAAAPITVPPSVTYPPAQTYPPTTYTPAPPVMPAAVSGTVVRVAATTYPGQLLVQTGTGEVYTYNVVSGTTIVRMNAITGVSGPVSLAALRPGDAVQVTADQTGTAQSVQATFTPAAAPPPAGIASVTVTPSGRQLVVGDAMSVVAIGPAHGTASFAIQGLRTGIPMTESANQPGTYVGNYQIQPGDYLARGAVVVSITASNGQLLTATAPSPVSINASAIIPPAPGGAPVIGSPTPGSGIRTPFTVTGTATPGALVRVEADYSGTVLLIAVRGTLGTQTVTADANGSWAAAFTQAPPVRGVSVTISAQVVDYTGAARSPSTTVNTTLQ